MGNPPVTIYTTPSCGYCKIAKQHFKANNIQFTEVNVDGHFKKIEEMVELSGQLGVPVIKIGETVQVGWDRKKFETAYEALTLEHGRGA